MKKALILLLAGVNVALLLVLVLGLGTPDASAQARGRSDGLAVVTAHVDSNEEVLVVVDTSRHVILAWELQPRREQFVRYQGRSIAADLKLQQR